MMGCNVGTIVASGHEDSRRRASQLTADAYTMAVII